MDFLDPQKRRRNRIMLNVGYVLIALAVGIGTAILTVVAFGFGIDKHGKVIQNGLVFFSSQPNPANIYVDGTLYKSQTNTRALLPSGNYNIKISAAGYRDWQRPITVLGGDVQHFDYPFLFPVNLVTKSYKEFTSLPVVTSQSPSLRWLLTEQPSDSANFNLQDLQNPKDATKTITVPTTVYNAGTGAQTWTASAWAGDNRRVLLLHTFVQNSQTLHEYIMFDTQDPSSSVNITNTLTLTDDDVVSLWNQKYNQYYIYNQTLATLNTATLNNASPQAKLTHVLAYKSYGSDDVLYVTNEATGSIAKPKAGIVNVVLEQGQKDYLLRSLPAGATQYSVDINKYSGDWYVVVAANNDKYAYVYKNPQAVIDAAPGQLPPISHLLRVNHPSYVSFSDNDRFVMAENGQQFGVYDAEEVVTYNYTISQPIDQPQLHATWMDGHRLLITSGGKLVVFEYDDENQQSLEANDANYLPFFDPKYQVVYDVTVPTDPASKDAAVLTSTALIVPKK